MILTDAAIDEASRRESRSLEKVVRDRVFSGFVHGTMQRDLDAAAQQLGIPEQNRMKLVASEQWMPWRQDNSYTVYLYQNNRTVCGKIESWNIGPALRTAQFLHQFALNAYHVINLRSKLDRIKKAKKEMEAAIAGA